MYRLNHSVKKGLSFGLTSGIITTLGLLIGLYASTRSELVVMGGILIIAVADSLSDAFGIHISEEAEGKHTSKEIWEATFATFISKLLFACTFIIPILLFELKTAVIVSCIWGLLMISIFSYHIAKYQKARPQHVILEHLLISVVVIVLTFFVGKLVNTVFA